MTSCRVTDNLTSPKAISVLRNGHLTVSCPKGFPVQNVSEIISQQPKSVESA